jgi:hypothetical protein
MPLGIKNTLVNFGYVTKTIIDQTDTLYSTATPFTIYARATDATWTAGADTIGGKSVIVVKNL